MKHQILFLFFALPIFFISACKKNDNPSPVTPNALLTTVVTGQFKNESTGKGLLNYKNIQLRNNFPYFTNYYDSLVQTTQTDANGFYKFEFMAKNDSSNYYILQPIDSFPVVSLEQVSGKRKLIKNVEQVSNFRYALAGGLFWTFNNTKDITSDSINYQLTYTVVYSNTPTVKASSDDPFILKDIQYANDNNKFGPGVGYANYIEPGTEIKMSYTLFYKGKLVKTDAIQGISEVGKYFNVIVYF